MALIKLLSIPGHIKVREVISDLKNSSKLNRTEIGAITVAHTQELGNNRYHLRLAFNNFEVINKIKRLAEATTKENVYKIRVDQRSILFNIIDSKKEKFKTERISQNHSKTNLLLWIRLDDDETAQDIVFMLNWQVKIDFNYVSVKNKSCFISLKTLEDSRKTVKFFKKLRHEVKYSLTHLYLEIAIGNESVNHSSIKIVNKKGNKKERKEESPVSVIQQSHSTPVDSSNMQEINNFATSFPVNHFGMNQPVYAPNAYSFHQMPMPSFLTPYYPNVPNFNSTPMFNGMQVNTPNVNPMRSQQAGYNLNDYTLALIPNASYKN
jgi:hypothetical protein